MTKVYPHASVEDWIEDIQRALIKGELLIVIDDRRRRVGLVRTDRPPFLGLLRRGEPIPTGTESADSDDLLGIKRWERDKAQHDGLP